MSAGGRRRAYPGWAPRPVRPRGRRRPLRAAAALIAALVLVTAGAGAWLYEHLDGNIRGLPLFGGASGDAGRERSDALGRTPVNVLVIGSDSRADRADCVIGGDCGPGRNADVEMVLHLSADRSNATVMSVPRDTVADLPACRDPHGGAAHRAYRGQINASLGYGPGCTVAAVHALTGIPIDHFMMIGFTGVVRMSDAVGGVPVCVDSDVYDPYSHLRLARGRHTLKGLSALEFLRSRHAFGDGSDLGRTYAQHLYLAALLRRLKNAGTLGDPGALYGLADAATRALTVDNGLAGVPQLLKLARAVNKVPASRVTFTTMQNRPDPADPDRVLVAPAARALFKAIIDDRSLTAPGGGRSATGRALDRAAASPDALSALRARIAWRESRHPWSVRPVTGGADDSTAGAVTGAGTAIPGGGDASDFDAHQRTAGQRGACAQVSRYPTVEVAGVPMTPARAFAATRHIPLSAR
ncbi:LCP family protein [Streptomyces sp. SL13]|uniref:LCP family protein n=1 Tax=Streptantibioticus silvisoli TaxID=2705255 RepID=A0AA90H9K7_9ACTN|nr:LCP family protein [Streptantibioticus silvisoli]MDI5974346.1 LCP family protein [Streptantibioticus silvisoli]